MTAFADAPCAPWTPEWCVSLPTGSEAVTGVAVEAASEILWALSGRRFGECSVSLRPCRRSCNAGEWPAGWVEWPGPVRGGPSPALIAGQWFNLTCAPCLGDCTCGRLEEALLPSPVMAVTQVKIDGDIIPTGSYRVDNWRLLVRADGGSWPLCNDLSKADTEPGTWSVTVTVGETVPRSGQMAVAELAAELAEGCLGGDCRVPLRVQQLARQGVTISYPDPAEFAGNGLLGLPMCDRFLIAYNPGRLRAPPAVYSPDQPAFRRTST
jgi:hypothetical protein